MRWPIYYQLLVPVMSVVAIAIGLSSALTAWMSAKSAEERQQHRLQGVVASLADAAFPLNQTVLEKMSGLSGATFIVLNARGQLEASTLAISKQDLKRLISLPLLRQQKSGLQQYTPVGSLELEGHNYLAGRVSVRNESAGGSKSLVVLYPEAQRDAIVRQALYPPLLVGGTAAVVVAILMALLARRLVLPIQLLQRRAAVIASGDFTPVALGSRNDEIRDLSLSINHMVQQLEQAAEQLRRHERLRTLGQLGGGIAHQIRNSATGARMAVDLHRRECLLESHGESLDVASRQLVLMESYLQRFLTLGRAKTTCHRVIDLKSLVGGVLPLIRPACSHARIQLNYNPPLESIWIKGDASSLEQLLINLLLNAIDAAGRGQQGAPKVTLAIEQDQADAVLTVSDSGPGPSPDIGDAIFEPLVTDKADGAGLGLAVARQVVDEHHGTIAWRRQQEETCFIVRLPCASESHQQFDPESRYASSDLPN